MVPPHGSSSSTSSSSVRIPAFSASHHPPSGALLGSSYTAATAPSDSDNQGRSSPAGFNLVSPEVTKVPVIDRLAADTSSGMMMSNLDDPNSSTSTAGGGNNNTGNGGSASDDASWVKEPTENDVLCGRGGSINSHPGNERFRTLVEKRKRVYLTARFKREKRLIASSIVSEIRSLKPSGRFLSRDTKSGQWKDIGDEKARDKTSQALRENAPSLRAEIETELKDHRGTDVQWDDDDASVVQRADSSSSHASGKPPPQAHPGQPPHPPPPYPYSPWGYPYYGYPAPPPPGHHYPPPPPPHSYDPSTWPHPYPPPPYGYPHPHPHAPPPPQPPAAPKSALEQTAETIKSYFSMATSSPANNSNSGNHSLSGDNNSRSGSISKLSQPIHYVHNDKRRRMVKFREDQVRASSSTGGGSLSSLRRKNNPFSGGSVGTNSLMDDEFPDESGRGRAAGGLPHSGSGGSGGGGDEDMEPEHIASINDDQVSNSLMAQVANHILSSIGSWDAASTLCGHEDQAYDNAEQALTTPLGRYNKSGGRSSSSHADNYRPHHQLDPQGSLEAIADEDMDVVEWEGQEVLLMETNAKRDMPPPPRPRPAANSGGGAPTNNVATAADHASLGGFSSLGSCHSWLPEQISGAASFFSYNSSSRPSSTSHRQHPHHASNAGISPANSMDLAMDYSASIGGGTHVNEHYSTGSLGGSIGNHSLSRVFENEALDQPLSPVSPGMNHRALQQMPSWERSLRSRSPLSMGSMADDESLISKSSSKLSDSANHNSSSNNSGSNTHSSPDAMAWERRE